MAHSTPRRIARQVESLRNQFTEAPGLPLASLLNAGRIDPILRALPRRSRDRIYTSLVTLALFLAQIFDPDQSCRKTVARLVAHRIARGLKPCSPKTGADCKARRRLPEALVAQLTRDTGDELLQQAPAAWLWHGRPVKLVDGTTVSMPDTPENQATYPQPRAQEPGLGFPRARLVVLLSLAVGTVLDAAIGSYQGKQTGEMALFRGLHDRLEPGDVLLADRYYCSYWELAELTRRGVDGVCRLHQRRRADFRRGRRLGREDHRVTGTRPAQRPAWMTPEAYAAMPERLELRALRVRVPTRGTRTRVVVVVTSLLDPGAVSRDDVAALYRARWHAELDLRAIKAAMQMDVLRCADPEMVRKEIWAHLLGYNLIRAVMARAAAQGALPRELSFTGALQTLDAFRDELKRASSLEELGRLWRGLLEAIASHRVGDRADRVEPRARKRRPKPYPLLTKPRDQARRLLRKAG